MEGAVGISVADAKLCESVTATGRRLAQRAVKSGRRDRTKNVVERGFRGGLLLSHPAATIHAKPYLLI